jgi:arylsulfatase A-like enzyme
MLRAFAIFLTGVCSCLCAPNLIVIMVDDMGYQDVGFNGCTDIPTPHIDSIADKGVRFTSGYVAYPVCGPSRAAFMTGRYGQRFGFERNPQYRPDDPNMGLTHDESTIAESLREAGYHSGAIGKWHLGAHESHHPLQRGFQEFYGHLGGGHQYFPEALTIKDSSAAKDESESYRTWILRNSQPVPPRSYLTDEFSDEAVSFVERNYHKPFFLYLAYNAPHGPLQASEKYLARFAKIADKKRRTYAAMVSAVDDGVGRLLAALRKHGVEDDTLVFFLSDNGGPESKNASNNGPLREGKGSAYDGGWRVPFAAQWPGTLPKGKVYDEPIISLDIFGTIAALSGARSKRPLDGVNLIPYLTGQKQGRPHEALYLRKFDNQAWALRSGNHKLVITYAKAKPQLFNIEHDIGESKNIAASQPEVLKRLDGLRQRWAKELVDPTFLGLIHTPAWQNRKQKKSKP